MRQHGEAARGCAAALPSSADAMLEHSSPETNSTPSQRERQEPRVNLSYRYEVSVSELTAEEHRSSSRARQHERFTRTAVAGFLSAVLLVCTAGFVGWGEDKSTAPAGLAQSSLWLGKQTNLAPAASVAQAMWRKTVGDFQKQQLSANKNENEIGARSEDSDGLTSFGHGSEEDSNPFGVSADREVHGQLLPVAKLEQGLWESKLKQLQEEELDLNRDVMNNVVLLHSSAVRSTSHDPSAMLSQTRPDSTEHAKKQAALKRVTLKAARPARIVSLNEEAPSQPSPAPSAITPPNTTPANAVQQPPPPPEAAAANIVTSAVAPWPQRTAAASAAAPAAAAEPAPAQPVQAAVVAQQQQPHQQQQQLQSAPAASAPATAAPIAPVLKGSSDTESRSFLSSFFDALAKKDEDKIAIHAAKYKRASPTPVLVQPTAQLEENNRVLKEVVKVEDQMEWLKNNLKSLNALLLHPPAPPPPPPPPPPAAAPKPAAKPPVVHARPSPPAQAKQLAVSHAVHSSVPPGGCPLFPAQGEVLPPECPNQQPALAMYARECADGSIRFRCPHNGER